MQRDRETVFAVIARSEGTKQSTLPLRLHGLLRFARNDVECCGCLKFESVRIRGANAGLRGRSLSAVGDQAAQQVSQISAAGSRTFPSSTLSGSRAVLPKGKSATCAFVRAAASHDRESQ